MSTARRLAGRAQSGDRVLPEARPVPLTADQEVTVDRGILEVVRSGRPEARQ